MPRGKKRTSSKTTRKFNGKNYRKTSCHSTKGAASKKAKSIRAAGGTARVVGKCVYKGPRAKKRRR